MENEQIIYDMASINDLDELVKLRLDYIVDDFGVEVEKEIDTYKRNIENHFKNNLGHNLIGFIARINGKIIATAYLLIIEKLPNPYVKNGLCGEVLSVYTKEEYRKKGIAHQLLLNLIDYAKDKKLSKIDLKATTSGYNLYKRVGFVDLKQKYTNMRIYL